MKEKVYVCDYAGSDSRKMLKVRFCLVTGIMGKGKGDLDCTPEMKERCAEIFGQSRIDSIRSGARPYGVGETAGHVGSDLGKSAEEAVLGDMEQGS